MNKKYSVSSVLGKRTKKKKKDTGNSKIDYSDIPRLSDEELKKMRPPGRPLIGAERRQMIAIRLDRSLLQELKKIAQESGKGYQTLINEILAKHLKKKIA